jgi:hypothetical protein
LKPDEENNTTPSPSITTLCGIYPLPNASQMSPPVEPPSNIG